MFVTPFLHYIPIENEIRKLFFGQSLQALKHRNVRVLDGAKIAELLCGRLPFLASKLLGPIGELKWANREHLSNNVLLSALDYNKNKDIKQIYTDIDLSMGNSTTRLFFGSTLSGQLMQCIIKFEEWCVFKAAIQSCRNALSIELVSPIPDLESIDRKFSEEWEQYCDYTTSCKQLDETYHNTRENLVTQAHFIHDYFLMSKSEPEMTDEVSTTRNKLNGYLESLDNGLAGVLQRYGTLELSQPFDVTKIITMFSTIANQCKSIPIAQMIEKDGKGMVFHEVIDKCVKYYKLFADTINAKLNITVIKEPQYTYAVDGRCLAKYLENERNTILQKLPGMKSGEHHFLSLAEFLTHSKMVIDVAQTILASKSIRAAVGVAHEQVYALDRTQFKFSCPLKTVIDSGVNILLLGEAGAGKTTSMQMYALNRLENSSETVPLFIPLASMLRAWKEHDSINESHKANLLEGIAWFFSKNDAIISADNLREFFSNERTVVLIDGVDEVVKSIPWIIDGISELSQSYPNIQIVSSSRSSGDYIDRIPFISVTLLPFNVSQREHFVRAWFGPERLHHINHVAEHLNNNPRIAEVASNPLLATVMCTLEESNVRLPDTEVMLYEERLRLLLGDYDIKKGIARLRTKRHILELASRKIAMNLHILGHREENKDWFYSTVAEVLEGKGECFNPDTVVNELLDPCNILVPMSDIGQIGFGHLRYQEYLVAKELNMNRYYNLHEFIHNPWWRGAFELLAQMADKFLQLLDLICQPEKYDRGVEDMILAMISARPQEEQENLRILLEKKATFIYKSRFQSH